MPQLTQALTYVLPCRTEAARVRSGKFRLHYAGESPTCAFMSVEQSIRAVAEIQREISLALDRREAALAPRLEKAQNELRACLEEQAQIQSERSSLSKAQKLYAEHFGIDWSDVIRTEDSFTVAEDPSSEKKKRTRIGPQRYRMWMAIRNAGALAEWDIAKATQMDSRRVRSQMYSDGVLGYIDGTANGYVLTSSGNELLTRFERYKKDRGEPLPSLEGGPISDDERDDDVTDDQIDQKEFHSVT